MSRSRRPSLAAALAALAAMLFLQAAIAFAPCELPGHGGGMAGMHESMPAMPAHDAGMVECDVPLDAPTLCLAKTHNEDQALGKTSLSAPDFVAPAPSIRPWQPPVRPLARVERVVPTASPPPRILFQSFLL